MCTGDIGLIFYTDVGEQQPVARVIIYNAYVAKLLADYRLG